MFVCQVSQADSQASISRLQWRIQFEGVSPPDVKERFDQHSDKVHFYEGSVLTVTPMTNSEHEKFYFNLTSIMPNLLESTMSTATYRFLNGASVQCGQDINHYTTTVIHIIDGV